MSKTTLINLHTYDKRYVNKDYVLIDRRTIYGNHKYKIGNYNRRLDRKLTRQDCVDLFKIDFWCRINEDTTYRSDIEKLRGKKLACWCTPLACHGNVYVEYFEG